MAQDGVSDCQTILLEELLLEALQAWRPLELRWDLRRDWVLGLRS
jgi:hypothetical protein